MRRTLHKKTGLIAVVGLIMVAGLVFVGSAVAATQTEIVDSAKQDLVDNQNLQTVFQNGITEGQTSGLDLMVLCGALGETVMENAIQADREGSYTVAGQAVVEALAALNASGLPSGEVLRAISMVISGIRVAGNTHQLDANLLQVSIENAVSTRVSEDQRELILRLVSSEFSAPVAATYTPAGPGPQDRFAPRPPGREGGTPPAGDIPPTYSGELPT